MRKKQERRKDKREMREKQKKNLTRRSKIEGNRQERKR